MKRRVVGVCGLMNEKNNEKVKKTKTKKPPFFFRESDPQLPDQNRFVYDSCPLEFSYKCEKGVCSCEGSKKKKKK